MAEVALATIGGAASVVQLGDVALRLCRAISGFIGELKDAKDDMRSLRNTLNDTNSLMRNLVAYIREFQNAPSTNKDYDVLPEAVVGAVQHFHDSLESLRECLPPDLSPGFTQKFRFVFNKKRIRKATSQLEGCKTSATLALNIICSQNNIKLRNDIGGLRIDNEAATQTSSQQTSQLLTEIQNISRQQSQATPFIDRVDKRTSDITTQLQSILDLIAAQNARSRQRKSTTTFTAADEDALAKLVRICVKQAVEMVTSETGTDERNKIDDHSTSIASQAHREGLFGTEEHRPMQAPATALPVRKQGQDEKSNAVYLFRNFKTIQLRYAIIHLRVVGLRHRQTETQNSASYFSVKIDITPRRLVPFGVSLLYTDAPDWAGYYSICPTIQTFNIIPDVTPIDHILYEDDVDGLQRLIRTRVLGLGDRTADGNSLISFALQYWSEKCIRYLINETETLDLFSNDYYYPDVVMLAMISMDYGLKLGMITLPRIYELLCLIQNSEPLDEGYSLFELVMRDILWTNRKHAGQPIQPIDEHELKLIQVCREYGAKMELFSWVWDWKSTNWWDIPYNEFFLEVYLEAGENPNAPLKSQGGSQPLEYAVTFLALKTSNECQLAPAPDTVSPRLLVILIKAGADVFFVREVDGRPRSITDLALELGVEYLWKAALGECGYDLGEVKMESERRNLIGKRLHFAERSGVDIKPLNEVFSGHSLRYRSTARAASGGTSTVD